LVFTNWLFLLFTIHVKPLHPDGSGGLGALGRLLWMSVAIMLWVALLLFAALLTSNLYLFSPLEMFLLSAVYVVLTPSLFIGWVLFPHRVMVKAREEVLQPLTAEFQQALIQSMPSTEQDTRTLIARTRRLAALKQHYDLVRETYPVWPVEISELNRLVATVGLPVLLSLILPLITALISFVRNTFGIP